MQYTILSSKKSYSKLDTCIDYIKMKAGLLSDLCTL